MEKKELFDDFSRRIDEIKSHYEDVETLHFAARLKNGTRFAFDYDSDRFERLMNADEGEKRLVSVFNGVVDILGAVLALVLMILHISLGGREFTISLMAFISFFTFFTTSAVYHLFDERLSKAVKVLFTVRMGLLALSQALMMAGTVAANGGATFASFIIALLIAAACLFFTSLSTKGAFRVASLTLSLMALLTLAFIEEVNSYVLQTILLAALSGIVPACMPTTKSRLLRNNRTLGIFYLVTLASFYLVLV